VSSPAAQRKACCVIRHFNAVTTTVNQAYSFILLAASNPAHPMSAAFRHSIGHWADRFSGRSLVQCRRSALTRSPHRLARDAHFLLGLPGKLDDIQEARW
jgi:hypothetical protein